MVFIFGLMYALNRNYSPELKYTFEVLQKMVMELERSTFKESSSSQKQTL